MRYLLRMHPICTFVALIALLSQLAAGADIRALRIAVLEGEGNLNNIRSRTSVVLVVAVRDQNGNGVEGAEVTFLLPSFGPGGAFVPDGGPRYSTRTDARGMARSAGFRPNLEEGRFNIRVSATFASLTTAAVIAQSNTSAGGSARDGKPSGGSKTLLVLLGLAGGGAAAGIAIASRGGKSTSPAAAAPISTSLSLGAVTVGGPR